jgi:hypothetical protein
VDLTPYRAAPCSVRLAPHQQERLLARLAPGEVVVRAGKPRRRWDARTCARALVQVVAIGAAVLLFSEVAGDFWPMMFPVWCAVVIGVGLLVAGVAGDLGRAGRTFYAVTDRRVLLFEPDEVHEMLLEDPLCLDLSA